MIGSCNEGFRVQYLFNWISTVLIMLQGDHELLHHFEISSQMQIFTLTLEEEYLAKVSETNKLLLLA